MLDKKIANRENYQKSKTQENRNKRFAHHQINLNDYSQLNNMKQHIKEICKCEEIPTGKQHQQDCPANIEQQKMDAVFRQHYVEYKTTFNYYRQYSPEWRLANWQCKKDQFKKDKVGIKQTVLKGKEKDNYLY